MTERWNEGRLLRRPLSIGTAVALAGILSASSPAQAQCPARDGTVPGTSAAVVAVGAHPYVVYVDDREFADLDGDGDASGLWIYLESNGQEGLQRGGRPVVFDVLADHGIDGMPYIAPVPVCAPVVNHCYTLFPGPPWWGAIVDEAFNSSDPCGTATPDTVLF